LSQRFSRKFECCVRLSENRGVPGSSPGLAIREPRGHRGFLLSGASRGRLRLGHASGHVSRWVARSDSQRHPRPPIGADVVPRDRTRDHTTPSLNDRGNADGPSFCEEQVQRLSRPGVLHCSRDAHRRLEPRGEAAVARADVRSMVSADEFCPYGRPGRFSGGSSPDRGCDA
jgi:hypothetical protein